MDVTCSRCQSVYEFEDTLVSPKGVVVRCTHCGHLFKIFPPGHSPSLPEESGWMLRREDGTVFAIDRFSTLQKWIAQGKVTRRDELSRTGESWKRIGDIVELSPFFDMVETSGTTQRTDTSPSIPVPASVREPKPAEPAAGPPTRRAEPAAPLQVSFAPDAPSAPPTIPADEPAFSGADTIRTTTFDLAEARRVSKADEPAVDERPTSVPPPKAAPEPIPARPASRPPRRPVVPPGDLKFSTAEFDVPRKRHGGVWIAVLLVVLAGAVVAGVLFRRQISQFVHRMFGGEESAATASDQRLARADRLFAAETPASLRQAEAEYADILNKFNSEDGRALGGLLELHTVAAQYLRDRIDVGPLLGLPGSDPAEAERLQRAFDQELAKARELSLAIQHSSKAAETWPVEALRAVADDARLRGDRDTARRLLELAVTRMPADARSRYVQAMVDLDDALVHGTLAAGAGAVEADFSKALSLDVEGSGLPRVRLHLALFFALVGRGGDAQMHLQCVIAGADACPGGVGLPHPDHALAGDLAAWLPRLQAGLSGPLALALPSSGGAALPVPPSDAAVPETGADAGVEPDTAAQEAEAGAEEAGAEAAVEDGETASEDAAEARNADAEMPATVEGLLDAARSALENGSTQRAIAMLQRAAQIDPTDAEVQVNLGYAHLDAGRTADARRAFERANQIDGAHPDALLGLGDILLSQGSLEAALDNYREALAQARTPYQRRIAERKVQDLEDELGVRAPEGGDAGGRTPPPPPPPPPPPTTTSATDVPISDMPAVDSEPPGLAPVTEP